MSDTVERYDVRNNDLGGVDKDSPVHDRQRQVLAAE